VQANSENDKLSLVNDDFAKHLHRSIWHPLAESTLFPAQEDVLACELLHLTSVMVQHYGSLLDTARKDIIRCASKFEDHDDMIVKQTAFLLSARFYAAFPSPPKFIMRTWTGLLRLPHDDGRAQLRLDAFAAIAPCLPRPSDGQDTPQWASIAKKMLVEEGQMHVIVPIYQVIVKEPALFYPVRAVFVPHIVHSLNKLGMSPHSMVPTRMLSIEAVEVIFNWDEQAQNAMEDGETVPWRPPLSLRENLLSYLVRLASIYQDPPKQTPFLPRIHALLKRMTGPSGWKDVAFGLRFFLKALEQVSARPNVCYS
jgi:transformation/transcription domain-associated protein